MAAVTIILLVLGPLLAGAGTLGFWIVAHNAPSPEDLRFARNTATIGRLMIYAGVVSLLVPHPLLAALAAAGFAAAASHLTRAPLQNVARGAWPCASSPTSSSASPAWPSSTCSSTRT